MKCQKCGTELRSSIRFCTKCGEPVPTIAEESEWSLERDTFSNPVVSPDSHLEPFFGSELVPEDTQALSSEPEHEPEVLQAPSFEPEDVSEVFQDPVFELEDTPEAPLEPSSDTEDASDKPKESAKPVKDDKQPGKLTGITVYIAIATVAAIILAVVLISKMLVPDKRYASAMELMNNGDYEAAAVLFEKLDGYKESSWNLEYCKEEAGKQNAYNEALSLVEQKDYAGASKKFSALGSYKDSATRAVECTYLSAVAAKENGSYDEAIAIFETLDGYKDSSAQIKDCNFLKINIGDTYLFGSSNWEWKVLDKKDDKILILRNFGTSEQYRSSYSSTTWETCTLRERLNGEFLNNFTEEERERIAETEVPADWNPLYSTNPGNDTTDKVFILSLTEVNQYLSAEERATGEDWWLRTPGKYSDDAAYINSSGLCSFCDVNCVCYVYPAMWIVIE